MLAQASLLFALLAAARAQSVPAVATTLDLESADAQYKAVGLDLEGNGGFGVELASKAILSVIYPSGLVVDGVNLTTSDVADAPEILVTPSNDTVSWFNASSTYTLALSDAGSLGDPDTRGNYRHFLANGLTGAAGSGGNLTFEPVDGTVITSYTAPGPLAGTGPHRYAWLLLAQPSTFTPPSNLSTTGVSAAPWITQDYIESTGLTLVGAVYFIVQNGVPTGSVAATQAINTATLAGASSSASSASSAASSASKSASSAATSASASSTGGSSGASTVVASVSAALLGVVGAVALL